MTAGAAAASLHDLSQESFMKIAVKNLSGLAALLLFAAATFTVAHWNENGEIVEENLFYDLMGMLKQIGVLPGQEQQKAA
jgi:hypothetical protein